MIEGGEDRTLMVGEDTVLLGPLPSPICTPKACRVPLFRAECTGRGDSKEVL